MTLKDKIDICNICRSPIISEEAIFSCRNCFRNYHRDHLKIWLEIDDSCPTCKNEMTKLAFTQFAIKHNTNYPVKLYHQLELLFPKGIPKSIIEKYIDLYPEGFPEEKFQNLKEKYDLQKESPNQKILREMEEQNLNFIDYDFFDDYSNLKIIYSLGLSIALTLSLVFPPAIFITIYCLFGLYLINQKSKIGLTLLMVIHGLSGILIFTLLFQFNSAIFFSIEFLLGSAFFIAFLVITPINLMLHEIHNNNSDLEKAH